jgi:hypothetical protein
MSRPAALPAQSARPLYLRDDELHALVNPHIGRAAFIKRIGVLEADGFPKVDPLFGGRYWPAVVDFFDRRAGRGKIGPLAIDGAETWGEAGHGEAGRDAGAGAATARGRRSALLERRQPVDPGGGLPREVDRFTARRHGR